MAEVEFFVFGERVIVNAKLFGKGGAEGRAFLLKLDENKRLKVLVFMGIIL